MKDSITSKKCSKCLEAKPLTGFHRHKNHVDGRHSECKSCRKQEMEEKRKNSPTRQRRALLAIGKKACATCKEIKDLTEFHLASAKSNGHTSSCKACVSKRQKESYHANPRTPELARLRYLKTIYGMRPDEYDAMLEAQGGHCACCGNAEESHIHHRTGKPVRLAIDHCHKTGKIRGLLCRACNESLGLLREDPARIQALLDYVLKHNGE